MTHSTNYDAALAAALRLLDEIDSNPGMPKYKILSVFTYTILRAIESSHAAQTFEPSAN